MAYRLLIVEDSPELLEIMSVFYREEGAGLWEVHTADNGNDALARVSEESYDLMILDIMLPGASGFDICKAARAKSDCPIIFVTALSTDNFILKGYETGGDDYVIKPFSIRHLYAKSLALLKRARKSDDGEELRCGNISLNKKTMMVKVKGRPIEIKSKEYFLLLYLLYIHLHIKLNDFYTKKNYIHLHIQASLHFHYHIYNNKNHLKNNFFRIFLLNFYYKNEINLE